MREKVGREADSAFRDEGKVTGECAAARVIYAAIKVIAEEWVEGMLKDETDMSLA